MREKKFRAFYNGEMIYPDGNGYFWLDGVSGPCLIDGNGKPCIVNDSMGMPEDFNLMQSTGLNDRGDQLIYELDIIGFWPNYTNKPTGYKKGIIKFTDYKIVLDVEGVLYDAFEETDEGPYSWQILGNKFEGES